MGDELSKAIAKANEGAGVGAKLDKALKGPGGGALEDGAASDYLDKRFADWGEHLGAMDILGLEGYRKRGGADALNSWLRFYPDAYDEDSRFQDHPKEELQWWKGGMDRSIASTPTVGKDLDLHMFRGVHDLHSVIGDAKVGDTFVDPGYVSTTTDIQVARDYAAGEGKLGDGQVIGIKIPKEAHAAWMRANPKLNDSTHELVLPRNSHFKIVDTNPGPGIALELELVLDSPKVNPKVQRAVERARGRRKLRDESWRFDPRELRDWHGRWTSGGLGKITPDIQVSAAPTSMESVVTGTDKLPPKVRERFDSALSAISAVHGPAPGAGKFPVEMADPHYGSEDMPPPEATTWFAQHGEPEDAPIVPGKPVYTQKMTLSEHPSGDPGASIVHEMGHVMDNELGGSQLYTNPDNPHSWMVEPEGRELIDAIDHSEGIRRLLHWLRMDDEPLGEMVTGIPKEGLQYLLDPREVFARAYAQWIISQTGDKEMRKETKQFDGHVHGGDEVPVPSQWTEDDFRPIAKAFTKLFRAKGLLKTQVKTTRSRGYLK